MFNALKYTQELEKVGFTREQSETSMNLIIEIMNENFATRSDLKELEQNVGTRIQTLDFGLKELGSRIRSLELKTESGFKELEYKLTIKLSAIIGTMMTLAIGVTVTLMKFQYVN